MKVLATIKTTLLIIFLGTSVITYGQDPLSIEDLLNLKFCTGTEMSPDGESLIYTVGTPRRLTRKLEQRILCIIK